MQLIKTFQTNCLYPEFAEDGVDPKIGEVITVDMQRYGQRTVDLLCDRGYEVYEPPVEEESVEELGPQPELQEE